MRLSCNLCISILEYLCNVQSTGYLGDGDTTETSTILETTNLQQANAVALKELHAPEIAAASISTKEGMLVGTGELIDMTEEEVYVERMESSKDNES